MNPSNLAHSASPAARRQTLGAGARPAKAPPPRKAAHADECEQLEQLPNIGPSLAGNLRLLGIVHPRELVARDAFALYQALCARTGQRQDPCVLDTFIAATDFMRGAAARPWWTYTAQRKLDYPAI